MFRDTVCRVTDDDRIVKRVGDATRARIDELAGGWAIDIPARPKEEAPVKVDDPAPGPGPAEVLRTPDAGVKSEIDSHPEWLGGTETHPDDSGTAPMDPTSPTIVRTPERASAQFDASGLAAVEANDATTMLPRTRGIVGDVRYVATVLLGVRTAKRELQAAEAKQSLGRASRQHHLTTLARHVVATQDFDHVAIREAREAVRPYEEKRIKHASAVAAFGAELDRIRHERASASQAHAAGVTTAKAEVAELTAQLEPLVHQAAAARRRAADVADQARSIGKQIAKAELRLASGDKQTDPVAIQAEIAALRAEQQAMERDQPTITAELEALRPQIGSLRDALAAAYKRQSDADAAEAEGRVRATELLEATGARRKLEERGVADAEVSRDNVLLELGQRLHAERPKPLVAQLGPIDEIDRELREGEQRIAELHDLIASVDRPKLVRGSVAIALLVTAVVAGLWLLVG